MAYIDVAAIERELARLAALRRGARMLDHTTRVGHPRSFGFMRLANTKSPSGELQVWEAPDGNRLVYAGAVADHLLRVSRTLQPQGFRRKYDYVPFIAVEMPGK